MAPVTAVILAMLAVALGVLASRLLRSYFKFRAMELAIPGPPSLPVLGNGLSFVGIKDTEVLKKVIELWGHRRELSRVSIVQNLILFVNNAEDVEKVIKRKEFQDKAKFIYDLFHVIATKSLPLLNGEEWKMHRRALSPGFHRDLLERFVDTFNDETKAFVKRVTPNKVVDPTDNMFRVGSRVFLKTMLTTEDDAELEELGVSIIRFSKFLTRNLSMRQMNPLLWSDLIYKRTQSGKEILAMKATIDESTKMFLQRSRAELKTSPEHVGFVNARKTILDILLDKDNKYPMTDEEIGDEIKIIFGASVESVAASENILLKILSLRHDFQDRIRAELMEVFEDSYRDVTAHDLKSLFYMERFVLEALRMYPVFPFLARQCWEETELNGYKLPANTTVVLNIYGVHRDPEHWPDPLKFDPDRFLPENCEKRHPYAFIPFSAGPRNCIAYKYALMNIMTFLANVLRAFRIDPVEDGITDISDIPFTFDLSMRILGGSWTKFTPRTDIQID